MRKIEYTKSIFFKVEICFSEYIKHTKIKQLFGNRYNQLPGLIEQTPQWLPEPSPLLPAVAGPLADYQTGFKLCSTRCNFYSTIGMG
jgi:hypothetical protein